MCCKQLSSLQVGEWLKFVERKIVQLGVQDGVMKMSELKRKHDSLVFNTMMFRRACGFGSPIWSLTKRDQSRFANLLIPERAFYLAFLFNLSAVLLS